MCFLIPILDSEGAADVFVDTSGLETRSLADESAQHSPTSIAGYGEYFSHLV